MKYFNSLTALFLTLSLSGNAFASGSIYSQFPLVGTFAGKTTGFAGFPLPPESQIPFVAMSNADRLGYVISLMNGSSLVEAGPWTIAQLTPDSVTLRFSLLSAFSDPEGLFITSGECAEVCWSYGITHTTLLADGTWTGEGRGVFLTTDGTNTVINSPYYDKPNSYTVLSEGKFLKAPDFEALYNDLGIPLPPLP